MLKLKLLGLLAFSMAIGACGKNNGTNETAYVLSHPQPSGQEPPRDLFDAVSRRDGTAAAFFANQDSINSVQGDETPLELALATDAVAISNYLSAFPGLNIYRLNAKKQSYLFQASRHGQVEVLHNLLAAFAAQKPSALTLHELDQPTAQGQIALHVAATGAIAKILLAAQHHGDDDVRYEDEMGFTPIHQAVSDNRVATIHWMVSRYCNDTSGRKNRYHPFNHRERRGRTPLMIAGLEGSSAMLDEVLRCKNVQIDAVDEDGNTALHWAAFNTDSHVFEKLTLQRKLNPAAPNNQGLTPMDIVYCIVNERAKTPIDPSKKDACTAVDSMN
jgi:ankyrin repeat protein